MPIEEHIAEPLRRRLYLPAYRVAEAARYAGAKPGTVSSWHTRGGRLGPVLPGREPGKPLSYLQLVEAAFVADFRSIGISMPKIRKARDYLMKRFDAEYPFAQLAVRQAGAHIVMDLLDIEPDADLGSLIIADSKGQLAWSEMVEDRFAQFEYVQEIALRWHVDGWQSPVVIDARVSFGAPSVKGVPTWALRGRRIAGETIEDIADDFGLQIDEVEAALAFEHIPLVA
ncbi:MAG TPA: DUF433 domain-containing protein [Dehalococcoidia bacterium]|nr:DUF433 domain-containing protein [Dehalococcoidia bacterium]